MNVGQLQEILSGLPFNMRVVVDGYEDGLDDLTADNIEIKQIYINTGGYKWEGEHSEIDEEDESEELPKETALILHRPL